MHYEFLIITAFLLIGAVLSVWSGKLTLTGGLTGILAGALIYAGCGFTGIAMLSAFFIIGTSATNFRMVQKQAMRLAEKDKGKRKASQVIANAGVASILGFLVLNMEDQTEILRVMIAASLAAATSDTLSSETGNVYGTRFYNIITLKKDTRGMNGVISLEGTLIGILGTIMIAAIYFLGFGSASNLFLIIIAGTCGNLFDSILGATLERKGYLNNDAVNFLNTAAAALIAFLSYRMVN